MHLKMNITSINRVKTISLKDPTSLRYIATAVRVGQECQNVARQISVIFKKSLFLETQKLRD